MNGQLYLFHLPLLRLGDVPMGVRLNPAIELIRAGPDINRQERLQIALTVARSEAER